MNNLARPTSRSGSLLLVTLLGLLPLASTVAWGQARNDKAPIIWRDPGDIAARNLYLGPGGKDGQPPTELRFSKEDKEGTNPKFDLEDGGGTKWRAKLGTEVRPETVASRLLWAVGFFADEDYFLPEIKIGPIPTHLKRGRNKIGPDGTVHNVRLKKREKNEKKEGRWQWRHNPLAGAKEFNGLRVMMALINNWDLKDENNAILQDKASGREIMEVSDLGASFGTTGLSWTADISKDNIRAYSDSPFITKVKPDYVDFATPSCPNIIRIFGFVPYVKRVRLRWIGKHVPREDARWVGNLLGQLSPQQIRDAFRAAGYSPAETDALTKAVSKRIDQLKKL